MKQKLFYVLQTLNEKVKQKLFYVLQTRNKKVGSPEVFTSILEVFHLDIYYFLDPSAALFS